MGLEQYAQLTKTYVEFCWKCKATKVIKTESPKLMGETFLVLCCHCGGL